MYGINETEQKNLHPCSAATLNSSCGTPSANFFASLFSVTASNGLAECWLARISSATGGGRYAWFDAPNCGRGVAVIDAALPGTGAGTGTGTGEGRATFAETGDDGDGEEIGVDE